MSRPSVYLRFLTGTFHKASHGSFNRTQFKEAQNNIKEALELYFEGESTSKE